MIAIVLDGEDRPDYGMDAPAIERLATEVPGTSLDTRAAAVKEGARHLGRKERDALLARRCRPIRRWTGTTLARHVADVTMLAVARGDDQDMRLFGRRIRQAAQQPVVVVDDRGVRRTVGGDVLEAVGWDELTAVDVVTTADGPFAEDVFLVLSAGDDHGCVVPQEVAGDDLVDRLFALEGFDHEQFVAAMSSVTEARFVCWRAPTPG